MSAVIGNNYLNSHHHYHHNKMFATFTLCLLLFFVSAGPTAVVQCRPNTSDSFTTTAATPSRAVVIVEGEHNHHHRQSRPSLRDLFFSGLFLLRPSVIDTPIETLDAVKAVPEIDNNELPPLVVERSTDSIESQPPQSPPSATASAFAAAAPPPPLSPSLYARFNALSDRLSTEKAILPPAMPVLHQVSSDQVVKKINYISPRLMDSIPQLVMTD